MGYVFNPFTGNFDVTGAAASVPDPLTVNNLTVNTLLTAAHIHGNVAGSLYIHVKNTSNTTLAKGTPVYAVGAVGDTTTLEIAAADSADPAKSPAIGILDEQLIHSASGHAVMFGEITGVNTGSYQINDELYVAAGGGLTATKPATGYVQAIAIVGRVHSSTGTLLIKIGSQMDDAAGSSGQIQFNDGGNLGADADLTYDKTTSVLTNRGDISLDDGGSFTTTLQTITPTANRTISLPDATGTVGLVAGSSGNAIYNLNGAYAGLSTLNVDGSGNLTLSGRLINSYTSLASAPAKQFTGTWFTGGTATTTKPHFLIEPAGTTSTAWSTSGTGLGVNAPSGFAGNLLDLQINGTRLFSIPSNANATFSYGVTAAGFTSNNSTCLFSNILALTFASPFFVQTFDGGAYAWSSTSSANGTPDLVLRRDASNTLAQRNGTNAQAFRVYNTFTSATNHERGKLEWSSNVFNIGTEKGSGGGTARAMALQTDGTNRLVADTIGSLQVATALTVAALPPSPLVGMIARVTDASAPTAGSTVTGGGSANALCWYNGTSWTVLGV